MRAMCPYHVGIYDQICGAGSIGLSFAIFEIFDVDSDLEI